MTWLFASGHAVDLVLAVMMVEACWVIAARGVPVGDVAGMMVPGALILLAARASLTGAEWPWIALPLAASFPAHLGEVARRGWLRPAARMCEARLGLRAGDHDRATR